MRIFIQQMYLQVLSSELLQNLFPRADMVCPARFVSLGVLGATVRVQPYVF